MSSEIENHIVERNEEYASGFKHGQLALPPAKKYLVVTCMDARIDPAAALGVELGDAHVVRNAGGSAREALRSIIISQQLLGTREVVLVKHTDCGMVTFENKDAHAAVATNLGPAAAAEIASLDFLPFPHIEDAVRDDVNWLRKSAAVHDDVKISGWVYDVNTGRVKKLH